MGPFWVALYLTFWNVAFRQDTVHGSCSVLFLVTEYVRNPPPCRVHWCVATCVRKTWGTLSPSAVATACWSSLRRRVSVRLSCGGRWVNERLVMVNNFMLMCHSGKGRWKGDVSYTYNTLTWRWRREGKRERGRVEGKEGRKKKGKEGRKERGKEGERVEREREGKGREGVMEREEELESRWSRKDSAYKYCYSWTRDLQL